MTTLRFGLVGYGAWGRYHAAAIAKTSGAQLVAVAVRSAESRAAAQTDHPEIATYGDYREMLRRDDLDVVDVVLPSDLHFDVGSAVLESGRHLLIEKPLAIRVEDCRRLTEIARSRGKLLAVGFELRHSDLWGRVKQLVADGAIGEPRFGLIELWRRPYRPGSQGWRFDINRVGNWVLEEPVHFFDLARWYFAGLGEPRSVYACASSKQVGHPELQDNFTATLRFKDDACIVIAQTLAAYEHHQTVKLTGTKGALWAGWSGVMDRDLHPRSSLKHFDGERVLDVPLERPTGEVFELEDEIAGIVHAINYGAAPAATAEDGTWAVALCQAAQESIDRQSVVSLEDFSP